MANNSKEVLQLLLVAYPMPVHLIDLARDLNLGGTATRQALASLIGRLAANSGPDFYFRVWKPDPEIEAWAITVDRPTV